MTASRELAFFSYQLGTVIGDRAPPFRRHSEPLEFLDAAGLPATP